MSDDTKMRRVAWLVAVWGFSALVATGQVLPATLIVIYAIFGVFLFRPRFLAHTGRRLWILVDLAAVLAALAYIGRDLGTVLVYLTAYLQFRKLVHLHKPRDYQALFAVSFGQVVLASAISADLEFGLLLVAFLGLAILGILLVTLERDRLEAAKAAARIRGVGQPIAGVPAAPLRASIPSTDSVVRTLFTPSRLLRTGMVCLAILPVTAIFFALVPRLAVRKVFLRLRPFESESVTGFSEVVEVGALSETRKDRTEVMKVWVEQPSGEHSAFPSYLRLRGLALDLFDGTKWNFGGRRQYSYHNRHRKRFEVPFAKDQYATHALHLKIEQSMQATNGWFFGPPFIHRLRFSREVSLKHYEKWHAVQMHHTPREGRITYWVDAYLEPSRNSIQRRLQSNPTGDSSQTPPTVGPVLSASDREDYVYVGPNLPERDRIETLAREVTRDATSPYERVVDLGRFFHERYNYSDEPQRVQSGQFVADFLFRRRAGHCETFATAMALLCRMVDVPARVVNGYYTSEYNVFEEFFYVRQCNAHTWVEAFIDGHGWMTTDPTPPAALPGDARRFRLLAIVRDYWDSWTMRWRRWVVDYSLTDQMRFAQRMRSFMASLRGDDASGRHDLPAWAKFRRWLAATHERNQQREYTLHKISLAGLVVAWVVYRRQSRRNGRRRRARVEGHRLGRCPIGFYAKILAALKREGWTRAPGQTPAEFARAVVAADPDLSDLETLTRAYYRVRYAPAQLQPDENERATALLTLLGRVRRRR